jgi:hypothetical protein
MTGYEMQLKRSVAILAVAAGSFGLLACIVGVWAVWSLGSRLEKTNAVFFTLIDKGLEAAQVRARKVQDRVKESKITATEIDQRLREWGASKTKEDLVSRFDIEARAGKLSGHLKTADSWLETSAESIQSIQQILELGTSVGARLDPATVQGSLSDIMTVRNTLQQAERTLDDIREIAANKAGESDEIRRSRITKLLGRVLVTIGAMDTRLDNSITQLAKLQASVQQLKAKTNAYILAATIVCYLLLAWIAAGQVAMCQWGWSNRRGSCYQTGGVV